MPLFVSLTSYRICLEERIVGTISLNILIFLQISVSDTYSKNICKKCCTSLKDAINFTCCVQNNDIVLRKRHKDCTDKNPLWPKPIQVDKNITGNAFNEMSVEVKQVCSNLKVIPN